MNYYFEADKLEPFFLKSAIFKAFINKVEYDSITNDVFNPVKEMKSEPISIEFF